VAVLALNVSAQGRGAAPAGRAGGPPSARAAAPFDPTGYWVAIISEDWRWRMVTPAKGTSSAFRSVLKVCASPRRGIRPKDEAAGEQCKAYGAPGLMRGPTRLHITWQDDNTLKIESDYGQQTRLLRFTGEVGRVRRVGQVERVRKRGRASTTAQWVMAAGGGRGRGGARHGSIKSVTTRCARATCGKTACPTATGSITEYWDLHTETNGDQYLVDTNVVDDPVYLQTPWITSLHFKKERTAASGIPHLRREVLAMRRIVFLAFGRSR
jgi:hypothetical protein